MLFGEMSLVKPRSLYEYYNAKLIQRISFLDMYAEYICMYVFILAFCSCFSCFFACLRRLSFSSFFPLISCLVCNSLFISLTRFDAYQALNNQHP